LEVVDALLLEVDDVDQLLDQRRAFGLRTVGNAYSHGPIRLSGDTTIIENML
jgi:hypothetical protein